MTQQNGQHATPGREMRQVREEGQLLQLPSSQKWVRLGPVAIDALMIAGKIPDLLTPLAASVLWAPKWITQEDAESILTEAKAAREYVELIGIICRASLREPKVVDAPTADDEISLDDLDIHDKFTIFNISTQPLGWLHRFREQQAANVESVLYGEEYVPAQQ
jgi:hypothetical protein